MHTGMGFGRGFHDNFFSDGFMSDPFTDGFFNFGNHTSNRKNTNNNNTGNNFGDFNNNRRNDDFEENDSPKARTIKYVVDGKTIIRTEEPFYEEDGTVKIHVTEKNEDGDVVEYIE